MNVYTSLAGLDTFELQEPDQNGISLLTITSCELEEMTLALDDNDRENLAEMLVSGA